MICSIVIVMYNCNAINSDLVHQYIHYRPKQVDLCLITPVSMADLMITMKLHTYVKPSCLE